MKNWIGFTIMAFTFLGNLNAQGDYNLLWRISGNGLQQDSYLFGTIHVSEEIAFNFSDSVLLAFENADILALEISSGDYLRKLMTERNSGNQKTNDFKDAFSEEEYEKIRNLIKDRTDIDIENSKDMSPRLARRLLSESEVKITGNQRTETMDNYFEFTAARLDKDVIGLEKPGVGVRAGKGFDSDMEKAFFEFMLYSLDSLSTDEIDLSRRNKVNESYDELINKYLNGNIEDFKMEDDASVFSFYDMENRNNIMLAGLDTLMRIQKVFCAVGVAHLPGNNGLIEMLRQKGYTLQPVNAAFTGLAKSQMKRFEKLEGVRVGSITDGFSVMMTGKPQTYPIPGGNMSIQIYQDASGGEMIASTDIPDIFSSEDQLLETIIENYESSNSFKLLDKRVIKHNGKKGYECLFATGESAKSVFRLFVENNAIYIFALLNNQSGEPNASKSNFLNSVEIYNLSTFKQMHWEEQELIPQKLKIYAPSPLINSKRQEGLEYSEDETSTIYQSFAMDRSVPIAVNIWQWQNSPGYNYADIDEALYQMDDVVKEEQNAIFLSRDTLLKSGFSAIRTSYAVRDTGRIESIIAQRGNTFNFIKVDYVGDRTTDIERLTTNWEFLPWEKPTMRFYEDENYAHNVVGITNSLGNYAIEQCDTSWTFSSVDFEAGISTDLYIYQLSEYAYFPNADTLVDLLQPWETETLKITEKDSIAKNGFKFKLYNSFSQLQTFALVKWAGNSLYRLDVNIPIDADSTYADSIHQSFQVFNELEFDPFEPKTGRLLVDLQSTDTATFEIALNIIDEYYFEKSDLKSMLGTLQEGIPLDSGKWNMQAYFNVLISFIEEEKELDELTELYRKQPKYQTNILSSLQDSENLDKLTLYRELLPEKTAQYSYSDFSLYYDSIAYLKTDISMLINILEVSETAGNLKYALSNAYQQDTIDVSKLLLPYSEYFDQKIRLGIDTLEKKSKSYIPTYELCNDLALALNAGNSTKDYAGMANKMTKLKLDRLSALIIFLNLANGEGVDKKLIEILEKDIDAMDDLFNLAVKTNKTDLLASQINDIKLAQYEIEINLYYEDYYDYGQISHQFTFNHNHEGEELRMEVMTYYDEYSKTNSKAYTVFSKDKFRAIYTTIYIENTENQEDQEELKKAIILDFETYY